MYNHLLDTFITVVDCGSFTKAAESLYMSPTAIMKQMNALEKDLDLKLINRTPTGVNLTPSGDIIYKDAKFIIEYSKKSISRAKSKNLLSNKSFHVGTSTLNPAKYFFDLWSLVNKYFPKYSLHLVRFEDNNDGLLSEINNLGNKFDFLVGACDSNLCISHCNFLQITKCKIMISVSREHRLSSKEKIELEDLYGENLIVVFSPEDSDTNYSIRKYLKINYPKINIIDSHFYNWDTFNSCADSGNVLLTIECWKDVHPGLVSIPVNWDYSIPYGIFYSKDATDDVKKFINVVKDVIK